VTHPPAAGVRGTKPAGELTGSARWELAVLGHRYGELARSGEGRLLGREVSEHRASSTQPEPVYQKVARLMASRPPRC
jgi:hypothetical protein